MIKSLKLILIFFFFFSCNERDDNSLAIGISLTSPPFGFISKSKDTVGVDINIAKLIGEKLNRNVKLIPIKGTLQRENYLKNGMLDFIVATYSITSDRKKNGIIFSNPYYKTNEGLNILANRSNDINNFNDLKYKRLGFVKNTTSENYYNNIIKNKFDSIKIEKCDNQIQLESFLENNYIDAIIGDKELIRFLHGTNSNHYTLINDLDNNIYDEYGIAISEDNKIYFSYLNNIINEITRENSNGRTKIDLWIDDFIKIESQNQIRTPSSYQIDKSIKNYIAIFALIISVLPVFFFLIKSKNTGKTEIVDNDNIHSEEKYFAWFIANSKYDHHSSLDNQPKIDCESLFCTLLNYNFSRRNMKISLNANKNEIINGFRALIDRSRNNENYNVGIEHQIPFIKNISPNDNLLIYYAGHGAYDETTESGYWIPVDAKKNHSEYIHDVTISTFLSRMSFKHVLLVTDSCFSGSMLEIPRNDNSHLNINRLRNNPSIQVLTSGAKEPVVNDSLFAKFFNSALNANENNYYSSLELYDFLKSSLNQRQTPKFGYLNSKFEGDFIFLKKSENSSNTEEVEFKIIKTMINLREESFKFFISLEDISLYTDIQEHILKLHLINMSRRGLISLLPNNHFILLEKGKNKIIE